MLFGGFTSGLKSLFRLRKLGKVAKIEKLQTCVSFHVTQFMFDLNLGLRDIFK